MDPSQTSVFGIPGACCLFLYCRAEFIVRRCQVFPPSASLGGLVVPRGYLSKKGQRCYNMRAKSVCSKYTFCLRVRVCAMRSQWCAGRCAMRQHPVVLSAKVGVVRHNHARTFTSSEPAHAGCVHRTEAGAHTDTELGRRRDIMSNLKAETLARWSLEGKTAVVTGGTKVGLWYTRLRQWFNSWCGRGRRPPYSCYPTSLILTK